MVGENGRRLRWMESTRRESGTDLVTWPGRDHAEKKNLGKSTKWSM